MKLQTSNPQKYMKCHHYCAATLPRRFGLSRSRRSCITAVVTRRGEPFLRTRRLASVRPPNPGGGGSGLGALEFQRGLSAALALLGTHDVGRDPWLRVASSIGLLDDRNDMRVMDSASGRSGPLRNRGMLFASVSMGLSRVVAARHPGLSVGPSNTRISTYITIEGYGQAHAQQKENAYTNA